MKRLFIALLFAFITLSSSSVFAMKRKFEETEEIKKDQENIIDADDLELVKEEKTSTITQDTLTIKIKDENGNIVEYVIPGEVVDLIISFLFNETILDIDDFQAHLPYEKDWVMVVASTSNSDFKTLSNLIKTNKYFSYKIAHSPLWDDKIYVNDIFKEALRNNVIVKRKPCISLLALITNNPTSVEKLNADEIKEAFKSIVHPDDHSYSLPDKKRERIISLLLSNQTLYAKITNNDIDAFCEKIMNLEGASHNRFNYYRDYRDMVISYILTFLKPSDKSLDSILAWAKDRKHSGIISLFLTNHTPTKDRVSGIFLWCARNGGYSILSRIVSNSKLLSLIPKVIFYDSYQAAANRQQEISLFSTRNEQVLPLLITLLSQTTKYDVIYTFSWTVHKGNNLPLKMLLASPEFMKNIDIDTLKHALELTENNKIKLLIQEYLDNH